MYKRQGVLVRLVSQSWKGKCTRVSKKKLTGGVGRFRVLCTDFKKNLWRNKMRRGICRTFELCNHRGKYAKSTMEAKGIEVLLQYGQSMPDSDIADTVMAIGPTCK